MTATTRSWVLTIPAPCEWLTANDRRNRWEQASLIRAWREAAFLYAKAAKLPTGLARVRIDVVARFVGRPPVREVSNLSVTLKAVVDGLGPERISLRKGRIHRFVGYGLVPDDDDKHVDGPHVVPGQPLPVGKGLGLLVLTITELPPTPTPERSAS